MPGRCFSKILNIIAHFVVEFDKLVLTNKYSFVPYADTWDLWFKRHNCQKFKGDNLNADYTRGLRQAIGVREFEHFLSVYVDKKYNFSAESSIPVSREGNTKLKENLKLILNSNEGQQNVLLIEAINKLKANTKRLVRRQVSLLN